VNPVPTKTGFSEYSHCYIIILHTVKSTAEQKGDGRRQINHEAEAYDDNMTLNFEQLSIYYMSLQYRNKSKSQLTSLRRPSCQLLRYQRDT
jgi:hypothetical protein